MAQEIPPDIPYDKNVELVPGRVDEPMPGVRRVLCNNPSPFTFKGTVSYVVGRGNVAIIDPGPEDPIHSAALLEAVRGETVTHISVTHTHRDHSPGVLAITAWRGRRRWWRRRTARWGTTWPRSRSFQSAPSRSISPATVPP